jgi:hypothetical protein
MMTRHEAENLKRKMELLEFESAEECEITQASLFLAVIEDKVKEGRAFVAANRAAQPIALIARLARLQLATKQLMRLKHKGMQSKVPKE